MVFTVAFADASGSADFADAFDERNFKTGASGSWPVVVHGLPSRPLNALESPADDSRWRPGRHFQIATIFKCDLCSLQIVGHPQTQAKQIVISSVLRLELQRFAERRLRSRVLA